jgi:hypothetical protein
MDSDTALALNLKLFPNLKRLMLSLYRGPLSDCQNISPFFIPPFVEDLELEICDAGNWKKIPQIVSQTSSLKRLKIYFNKDGSEEMPIDVFRQISRSHPHLQWQLEVREDNRTTPLLFKMDSSLPGVLLPVTWSDKSEEVPPKLNYR